MNWILIAETAYLILLILVGLRIVYDTRSSSKTLAYLLLIIFVPLGGILIYFSFGINYRKRLIYSKKLLKDKKLQQELTERIVTLSETNLQNNLKEIGEGEALVHLLMNDSLSPLYSGNGIKILMNGEEKFPEVINALKAAKHHIHIEYYIYENDHIGNLLKDILIEKAKEGLEVRFIYDDFGSRSIRRKFVRELRAAGVEAYPFNRIRILLLANRLNYRNHRKIIIVDGRCAFVGGINVSDRYINDGREQVFWRDTHLRIDGPAILQLQHVFLGDWNFCSKQELQIEPQYFRRDFEQNPQPVNIQIAASGPDSPTSTIMLSLLKAINLAKQEVLITTPYLIPGDSIINALQVAALGGVSVKILAPGVSDSQLVNAAAWSNYGDLLGAGVEIYLYRKGFVHAKTMVVDGSISMVGTANMDFRSFDLNFEVNAVIYSSRLGERMKGEFYRDLEDASRLTLQEWQTQPWYKQLGERIARLLSPLL